MPMGHCMLNVKQVKQKVAAATLEENWEIDSSLACTIYVQAAFGWYHYKSVYFGHKFPAGTAMSAHIEPMGKIGQVQRGTMFARILLSTRRFRQEITKYC